MCNIFSGHIVTEKGKDWGKVIVITGIHHEEDRKNKRVSKYEENLLAWETKEPGSLESGVKITHSCGNDISEKEKQALVEITNAGIIKLGYNYFMKRIPNNNLQYFFVYCNSDFKKWYSKDFMKRIPDNHLQYFLKYCNEYKDIWSKHPRMKKYLNSKRNNK